MTRAQPAQINHLLPSSTKLTTSPASSANQGGKADVTRWTLWPGHPGVDDISNVTSGLRGVEVCTECYLNLHGGMPRSTCSTAGASNREESIPKGGRKPSRMYPQRWVEQLLKRGRWPVQGKVQKGTVDIVQPHRVLSANAQSPFGTCGWFRCRIPPIPGQPQGRLFGWPCLVACLLFSWETRLRR